VLTIIATIFIPLSFVAGVYGMNFDNSASSWNMPELAWMFGYPAVLSFMGLVAGTMLFFFWRRGWFD
jgi:magnesium transporter